MSIKTHRNGIQILPGIFKFILFLRPVSILK